MLQTVPNFGTG